MNMSHKRFNMIHLLRNLARFFTSYQIALPWKIGDTVVDDLTMTLAKIQGIEWSEGKVIDSKGRRQHYSGCVVLWLDNDYLDGGRHPWEVSDPLSTEEISKWDVSLKNYRKKSQGG